MRTPFVFSSRLVPNETLPGAGRGAPRRHSPCRSPGRSRRRCRRPDRMSPTHPAAASPTKLTQIACCPQVVVALMTRHVARAMPGSHRDGPRNFSCAAPTSGCLLRQPTGVVVRVSPPKLVGGRWRVSCVVTHHDDDEHDTGLALRCRASSWAAPAATTRMPAPWIAWRGACVADAEFDPGAAGTVGGDVQRDDDRARQARASRGAARGSERQHDERIRRRHALGHPSRGTARSHPRCAAPPRVRRALCAFRSLPASTASAAAPARCSCRRKPGLATTTTSRRSTTPPSPTKTRPPARASRRWPSSSPSSSPTSRAPRSSCSPPTASPTPVTRPTRRPASSDRSKRHSALTSWAS